MSRWYVEMSVIKCVLMLYGKHKTVILCSFRLKKHTHDIMTSLDGLKCIFGRSSAVCLWTHLEKVIPITKRDLFPINTIISDN